MNWKRVELNKGGIDIGLNWEKRRIWKREESKKGELIKWKRRNWNVINWKEIDWKSDKLEKAGIETGTTWKNG